MANSHATKNPFKATKAAITASLPIKTAGESQCVTNASANGNVAKEENNKEFISRMRAPHPKIDLRSILPARFGHARDQSLGSEFAKRQTRNFEPANECAAATRHFAAVHHPCRAGIARKLGQTGVIFLRLQLGTQGGVFLDCRALAVVTIDPGFGRHKGTRNLVESPGNSTGIFRLAFSCRGRC